MDPNAFFSRLESLAERDTSVVATLRRSLSFDPGSFSPAFPIVEPVVANMSERQRRLHYLGAALWSLGQRRVSGKGVSLAHALQRVGIGRGSDSVTLRFTALLDSDEDELPHRLRQVVSLVIADQIAIDWPRLLSDLIGWGSESRYVQQRWAREYWSHAEDSSHPAQADSVVPAHDAQA